MLEIETTRLILRSCEESFAPKILEYLIKNRDFFKPWIFLIAGRSMDTGTMWLSAVFDPGWKNLIFCGLFFTFSFPGAI